MFNALAADGTTIVQLLTGAELEAQLAAVAAAAAAPSTQPVSASALPLPSGAATDAKVEAVRALLAAALPLPTGAATQTTLAGILAALGAALPLPTGAATAAGVAATASADDLFAITPSDTVALATVPKALLCTVAGNVAVRGTGSSPLTIPVTAGQILPIRARYVYATNTTATVIGLV